MNGEIIQHHLDLQSAFVSHQARGARATISKSLASKPFPDGEIFPSEGAAMASRDHFQQELRAQIERAKKRGVEQLIVNSRELLAAVGGRPDPKNQIKNQMRYCCDVMREEMKAGDAVVDGPENGKGPGLTICYLLSGRQFKMS
jgi:hypothetical protein